MIVSTQTLGDWVSRGLRAAQYQLVPAATRRDLESFVASLPGQARRLNDTESAVQAMVERAPRDPAVIRLRGMVADLRGSLLTIDRQLRAAAEDAKNDGHAITIAGNEVRTLGLPIAPLVIVAIVGAAIPIVLAYIGASQLRQFGENAINIGRQWDAIENARRDLIASGRPDLVPGLFPQNGGSGVSPWLVAGLGALVVAGAVGVAYASKGGR